MSSWDYHQRMIDDQYLRENIDKDQKLELEDSDLSEDDEPTNEG